MFFMGTPGKQTNKKQCILHTLYIEKKFKKPSDTVTYNYIN